MDTFQTIITIALLAVLTEVTYLVVKLPRQTSRRAGRAIYVDTSVLIDGRIVAVAKSGFIGEELVIPRSVIGELQFLADNADHDKRMRARFGLDVVTELQNIPQVDVSILQDGSKAEEGVDERLLKLAKKNSGAICTIDYNLNKVAVVEGIAVLNVNELAQSLRMAHLPGERIHLDIVQKGQDSHQGVGYLGDGTMVVVEHANKYIGKNVEIEFIRSLQTAAGKMMFARLVEQRDTNPPVFNKPAGKKPVPKPQQPQIQPRSEEPKKDNRPSPKAEQQSVRQQNQPHQQQKQQVKPNPQSQQQQPQQPRKQKQRRQKDREATLLDLVDKQDQ